MSSYDGKRVLVTGAGGAGIGAAVVEQLLTLGADVHAIDVKSIDDRVSGAYLHDVRDMDANRRALDAIGDLDAFFSCVGVSMAEPADVVAINFLSVRALTGLAVEQMGSGGAVCVVASIAARGWSDHVPDVEGILATPDYDAGVAWLAEHELPLPPYPFSKMATIVWALRSCRALGERGIRINTVSPGATETPMMAATFERAPETRTALEARPRALQRFSHPSEQASAIVFLNSDAASYVTGVDLHVDGGELAIDDPAVSGS